ncbi:D123-domain-containing protein [Pholiota conissans]|uniref:D123-domain-containing protein n=1 Tax=Pholiota conissans TaxID=109636 RepID=A0A9P5YQI1_9AGAR|nr:D123-domain-containing protein [Pholiota conissans]
MSSSSSPFPILTAEYILNFQFSSWYPLFSSHSIKSTIVRPLPESFQAYLDEDGVFVPEGSEDAPVESTLSDDEEEEGDDDDDDDEERRHYSFPELDTQIRACVKEYGGVFPKLNFSSPKDAAWLLPASSPLKCFTPADVYLLLKSSDFITHDLSRERVFEGVEEAGETETISAEEVRKSKPAYELELVLRKWYSVDRGREVRCFVREGVLLGISQRDTNFYEFWNVPETQQRVTTAVQDFWKEHIVPNWPGQPDYIFDFLLTRDLLRGHIIDFNPYHPKTDPLLFTYDELHALHQSHPTIPELRVIDSASHPAATKNAPAHQHNMIPFEALKMSSGQDIEEFADMWKESVRESMKDDDDA